LYCCHKLQNGGPALDALVSATTSASCRRIRACTISGHWTIDGVSVPQFEQHIRAVAGLPLGRPVRAGGSRWSTCSAARKWLATPGAAVHLYDKTAVRPGCKMGHVTQVLPE